MVDPIISFSILYWISYFLWIYSQISSNSSNVDFSLIMCRKSLWIMRNRNNEKIETNNWKDYLFMMIGLIFISQQVSIHKSVAYCRLKKSFFWICIHPQSRSFERRYLRSNSGFTDLYKVEYVSNKSERSFPQHCILSSTTLHSRSLPLRCCDTS